MFKNDLNPPPPKSPSQMFKPNATMTTMTVDDVTINVISWNHDFPSQNPY